MGARRITSMEVRGGWAERRKRGREERRDYEYFWIWGKVCKYE